VQKMVKETTDHLLLYCQISRNLWQLALSRLGLHWVMPNFVRHKLLVWEDFFGGRIKYKVCRAIPHAIFSLWMERNRRVLVGF